MELHHNSHEHSLFFVDGESETDDLPSCWGCNGEICGARYSCFTCNFHLHESCSELPLSLNDHPFHPHHSLSLLYHSPDRRRYYCSACNYRGTGYLYRCSSCNLDFHSRCALSVDRKRITVSERDGGKHLFQYGVEKHLLVLEEGQSAPSSFCFFCSESISAPFFSCSKSRCRFHLHKSCADLPQKILNNLFHPKHPLFLLSECTGNCQICGQFNRSFAYICKPCDFLAHPRCALSKPTENLEKRGEKEIQHFTHDHLLTLPQDEGEWKQLTKWISLCCLCEGDVSFPNYGCFLCPFVLHKSCAELPRQIRSHVHAHHVLFLFARPPPWRIIYCNLCNAVVSRLNYRCLQCEFMLHVDCFLSPYPSELYDHKHCFVNLKTIPKLTCQTCGEEGYFSPCQCSSCHILVHKDCAELPRFLKLESHKHNLKLTYYLSLVHKGDKTICKLCYRKVNVEYAAYYCSQCNYVAHLKCAPEVGTVVLEEENESQNSITEEDNNSGVIQHFSHQHELTLVEQELEDHKYCEGCGRLVIPPFYSCKQCKFYLHKRCGESLRTIEHSFHPHPLTLDVVEEPACCYVCHNWCNGLLYRCHVPNCRFTLDLQCADILLEGLQHPCHEHPLFFPHTRGEEKCKGCGEMEKHILVCTECDYVLCYRCLRIPHAATHWSGNHLLNLTCKNEDESGEYFCDICEEERDPKTRFYSCSACKFYAHIDCALGEFPHIKNGTTLKCHSHDHLLTLVDKCQRKVPPLCGTCGKRCYSRALECCQCNLHFHFTFFCIYQVVTHLDYPKFIVQMFT